MPFIITDPHQEFAPYKDGKLRPEIATICKATGLQDAAQLEPVDLARALMKQWVARGAERWEGSSKDIDWNLLNEFGWINATDELYPYGSDFDVLKFGSTLGPQARMAKLLDDLLEANYHFNSIAHLGAKDRKLNDNESLADLLIRKDGEPKRKPDFKWDKPYQTEIDMMEALDACLELSPKLRAVPTQFIAATKTNGRRANTEDTVKAWLDTAKPSRRQRRILIVSIQPHAGFQYWNTWYALNTDRPQSEWFDIHVAAPSARLGPQRLDYYMGALARQLRFYVMVTEGIDVR